MSGVFPDPLRSLTHRDSVEAENILVHLLDPAVPATEKIVFLDTLHRRGETATELATFATLLLDRAIIPVIERKGGVLVELCGTGGDKAGYLNVSTAAMFVVAGAGARVLKHGNRAVTSRCGSADVLEALGVTLRLDPARIGEVLNHAGCVFLLASEYHPVFASLGPLRREMADSGKRSIFNLLGPLLNPGKPDVQLTGIYNPAMLPVYAEALRLLGRARAWAVHGRGGESGVDELSILGPSEVHEVSGDAGIRVMSVRPEDAGLASAVDDRLLLGGDAPENAARIESILRGEQGAATDMILLNAGAALQLAGHGTSLADSVALARESMASGRAFHSLQMLREASLGAALRV